jgi:hypothetical protein
MATSPQSPVSLQPTRQQLEELDALMKRMLALPVDGPEEPAVAPPPESEAADLALPEPEPPKASEPAAAVVVSVPPEALPLLPPRRLLSPAPALLRPDGATARPSSADEPERLVTDDGPPPVSPWVYPLVWCNQVFDAGTLLLGPVGRWLRGPVGRVVLGTLGLLLLAAAAAWVALDQMGWRGWVRPLE